MGRDVLHFRKDAETSATVVFPLPRVFSVITNELQAITRKCFTLIYTVMQRFHGIREMQ